jgi:hypothetical protein
MQNPRNMHFGDVRLHQGDIIGIGNHKNVLLRYHMTKSVIGLFDEGFPGPHNIDELFWETLFTHWPESTTDSTGHYQNVIVFV